MVNSKFSRRQFLAYAGASALLPLSARAETSDLQRQLHWLVKRLRREGKISRSERTAWAVYDFHSRQKLVAINEQHMMQAASMVKLFVALAYFYLHQQAPHKYPYDWYQQETMEKMLVKSKNKATNEIMQWCKGPRNVARLCQKATGNRFSRLHIVEYIPKGGRTYKNRIPVRDYNRFFFDLWHDRLPFSSELKRILAIKNHDRMTTDLMPENITVYDKTGSTGMLCGDAGIIELDGWNNQAYTFIGVIERRHKTKSYGKWISNRSDAMREVSSLVYQFMDRHYRLLNNLQLSS